MPEEQVDVVVEEQQAPIVAEQQEETGADSQVAAEEDSMSDQDKNWKSARVAMSEQSEMIKSLKSELEQLKGQNMTRHEKKELKDFFDGRDDEDLPTVGEIRRLKAEMQQEWSSKQEQLETKARYPDMDDVINKYGKTLPESVRMAIINSPNPHLAAYEACKSSESYYKDTLSDTQHKDAKRAEANLKKPGNASAVGGAGALSKSGYYESMGVNDLLSMSDRFIRG